MTSSYLCSGPLSLGRWARPRRGSEPAAIEDIAHQASDTLQFEGLGQVGDIGGGEESLGFTVHQVAGDQDETLRQLGLPLHRLLEKLTAVHIGHPDVGNDQVELIGLEHLQGLPRPGADGGLAADGPKGLP